MKIINSSISNSERVDLKRVLRLLLSFSPFLLALLWMNLFIDPSKLYFGANTYDCIVENLNKGNNIQISTNLNERSLQRRLIEAKNSSPDILVLGSSRTLTLTKEMVGVSSFYNNSVSGASLQDFLGLFKLYTDKNTLPKFIVMSADAWLLNRQNQQGRWTELTREYEEMLQLLNVKDSTLTEYHFPEVYLNILSLSYFQKIFFNFKIFFEQRLALIQDPCLTANESVLRDDQVLYPDGSRADSESAMNPNYDDVKQKFISEFNKRGAYSIGNFREIDKDYLTLTAVFIKYLLDNKVKVFLYIPPYAPFAYDLISQSPRGKIVSDVEVIFREFEKFGVNVIGSYDPKKLNLTDADFIDELHLKKDKLESVLAKPIKDSLIKMDYFQESSP